MLSFLLSQAQAQTHFQEIHCTMNESFPPGTITSSFPKTTFHHEGNITHAIFPSITTTNTSPRNTLHHE
jgi:hypothetical protein